MKHRITLATALVVAAFLGCESKPEAPPEPPSGTSAPANSAAPAQPAQAALDGRNKPTPLPPLPSQDWACRSGPTRSAHLPKPAGASWFSDRTPFRA